MTARRPIAEIGQVGGLQTALAHRLAAAANSVVLFGSSVESQNGDGAGCLVPPASSLTVLTSRGWFNWANAFLGNRLVLVSNAGVGGDTYARMRARLTDVLSTDSGWVFIGGPVSDISAGRSFADIQTDLLAMLAVIGENRRVLLLNALPSAYYDTADKKAVLHAWNRYVQTLPETVPGLVVVDAWRLTADPATGAPYTWSVMPSDGIHPSEAGAMRIGKAVADALNSVIPQRPGRSSGLSDPDNVLSNPAFVDGTDWALASWSTNTSLSWEPLADRPGTAAVLTIAGAATSTEQVILRVEPIAGGRFAAGDIVQMEARLAWSDLVPVGGAIKQCLPYGRIYPRNADNSWQSAALFPDTSTTFQTASGVYPASGDIVLRTTRLSIAANVANLYVSLGWKGAASGVVRVTDLSLLRNAT